MREFILIILMAFAAFPSVSAAEPPAGISIKSEGGVKVRVFKSFKSLERKFGEEATAELKEFDFKHQVLAWKVAEFDADAKAEVTEVLPTFGEDDSGVRVDVSAGQFLDVLRTPKKLTLTVMNDSPCMGGAAMPDEMRQQCAVNAEASGIAARKRIVLFSTPRKSLKIVAIKSFQMPPRPSAHVQMPMQPKPVVDSVKSGLE
jgi:hypothetical protein